MDNNENTPPGSNAGSIFKRFPLFMRDFLHDPASRMQIIKFCSVGILNTIIGYGAFFILVNYLYYLVALLIAHIIGVIHSFLWNKFWIFKTEEINPVEFIKFNIIYIVVNGAKIKKYLRPISAILLNKLSKICLEIKES